MQRISDAEAWRQVWSLIDAVKVAMVVTLERDDTLHARPMATKQIETEPGRIWFFTNRISLKAAEMKRHRAICLAYADPAQRSFVSVSGAASIVKDVDKARRLWTQDEELWFPDGPEDANLVLVEVAVRRAEYWDVDARIMRVLAELGPDAVDADELVTNRKLNIAR
jgi:general stress protein 26